MARMVSLPGFFLLWLRWCHWVRFKTVSMWCATEVEKMSSADSSTGMSAGQTRAERPRANSSGSIDQTRLTCGPAGGSITSGGKLMLQIPIGPQFKARRAPSPGLVRREWVSLNVAALQLACYNIMKNLYYGFSGVFFCLQSPGILIFWGYSCSSRQGLFSHCSFM